MSAGRVQVGWARVGLQVPDDHDSVETFRSKHFDFLSAMGEGQRVEPEKGIQAHEWHCLDLWPKHTLPSTVGLSRQVPGNGTSNLQ